MDEAVIYGFGSFFNNKADFQDIDILILHRSTSYKSCQFSLRCKKYLLSNLSSAHITILSDSEEHQLAFLEKSRAKYLGKVYDESFENSLDLILAQIIRVNTIIWAR